MVETMNLHNMEMMTDATKKMFSNLCVCVNLRPQSPEGQWEPKVLWVPAGEAEKGRDREEGRRKESAGQTWRSEKTLQRPSPREEEIWNAVPRRGNQTGEQNI